VTNSCEHHTMPDIARTFDEELSDFGVAAVGSVQSTLVEKVKDQIATPEARERYHRQTELRWSDECDSVVGDFETVSERA
jgi:hypothetical protein